MKDFPLFPLSHKGLAVGGFGILAAIFLTIFFLSPSAAKYKYRETKIAEVTQIYTKTARYSQGSAKIGIEFENGTIGILSVPTSRTIYKGQEIQVDIFEADGEKPCYRLAQTPIQP